MLEEDQRREQENRVVTLPQMEQTCAPWKINGIRTDEGDEQKRTHCVFLSEIEHDVS